MTVKIMNHDGLWLEGGALKQLETLNRYPGVELVVGLPDLHGGRSPVGLALWGRDFVYPYVVGSDIGCGMALWETDIAIRKFKLDKAEKTLTTFGRLDRLDEDELAEYGSLIGSLDHRSDLGTIGGGNHFAEFQKIETVLRHETADKLSLNQDKIFLLIHTGSRSLGQSILNTFNSETGYELTSAEAGEYLNQHTLAMEWAVLNRRLVAERLLTKLGGSCRLILDLPHNFIERRGPNLIHRKGAVSSERGPVLLPGSRGAFSYILEPESDTSVWAYSLSHGAGRKWARSMCRERLSKKKMKTDLTRTEMGSRVICYEAELLFQEAPEAYKNIQSVIEAMVANQAAQAAIVFKPLLTFKG
jgi:release factor H-coupled RctB family protein